MHDVSLYRNGELLFGDVRRAGRAISRYQTGGQVRTAKVDTETDVLIAKAEALTAATGTAMANVLRVAKLQQELEAMAPAAAARLAFLADDHMLGMADILTDLRRDLRRK